MLDLHRPVGLSGATWQAALTSAALARAGDSVGVKTAVGHAAVLSLIQTLGEGFCKLCMFRCQASPRQAWTLLHFGWAPDAQRACCCQKHPGRASCARSVDAMGACHADLRTAHGRCLRTCPAWLHPGCLPVPLSLLPPQVLKHVHHGGISMLAPHREAPCKGLCKAKTSSCCRKPLRPSVGFRPTSTALAGCCVRWGVPTLRWWTTLQRRERLSGHGRWIPTRYRCVYSGI